MALLPAAMTIGGRRLGDTSSNRQSAIGNRQFFGHTSFNRQSFPRGGISRQSCKFALLLAALAATVPVCLGRSDPARLTLAIQTYERATKMRVQLEARPEKARTLSEYWMLITTYRSVYATDPAYRNAAPSLAAVAELYREMGRVRSRPQDFTAAIKAYEFLINEYPFSVLARQASLDIAEIYLSDLNQPEEARQACQQLLEKHPQSSEAAQARKLITQIGSSRPASGPSTVLASPAPSANPPSEESGAKEPRHLAEVGAVRCWEGPGYTRVVIAVESEVKFDASRLADPDRLVFDLVDTRLSPDLAGKTFPAHVFLRQVRMAQYTPTITRAVLDVAKLDNYSVFTLPNPFRVVIDIHGGPGEANQERQEDARSKPAQPVAGRASASLSPGNPPAPPSPAPPGRPSVGPATASHPPALVENGFPGPTNQKKETVAAPSVGSPGNGIISEENLPAPHRPPDAAVSPHPVNPASNAANDDSESREATALEDSAGPPTASASTLTRVLGLKIGRIVIDPGHGGHDTGTVGPHGLREKDLVLDVGLRLRKLLEEKAGAEVIMTRSDDSFVRLEERTVIANQKDADLFVSIHANASRDASARGVETYYLNFTSDPHALEVAARENATSEESVHELQDLVKKIVLTEKIKESQVFADDVQHAVYGRLIKAGAGQGNRGVKRAPFVVLIGANMPSILAEISFLTNPYDERQLRKPEYRQRIAEALYQGIYQYVSALGGVKLAEKASLTGPSQAARQSDRSDGAERQ
ncbi:MAG TPA: N-acetylmuramoyl-L-alanine amidase [Terriglobia bacterium]|nr:N-acetylmuramoyl-L-alanine amidase [Terriglobia bacterium]